MKRIRFPDAVRAGRYVADASCQDVGDLQPSA